MKPLLILSIIILHTALVHFHSILSIAAVNSAFCTRIYKERIGLILILTIFSLLSSDTLYPITLSFLT